MTARPATDDRRQSSMLNHALLVPCTFLWARSQRQLSMHRCRPLSLSRGQRPARCTSSRISTSSSQKRHHERSGLIAFRQNFTIVKGLLKRTRTSAERCSSPLNRITCGKPAYSNHRHTAPFEVDTTKSSTATRLSKFLVRAASVLSGSSGIGRIPSKYNLLFQRYLRCMP